MESLPLSIDHTLRLNGVFLDEVKRDRLARFVDLLLEWNRRINLVSRRDSENIWESHILHSLSPLFMLDIPSGVSILDLGSGGGFPGIPIAIMRGDVRVTLLDSIQKKVRVLEDIVAALGLSAVRVVGGRAEDVGRDGGYAGSFDAVIARAVAPLADLIRWSEPFLRRTAGPSSRRKRGEAGSHPEFSFPYLLALKGGDLSHEIQGAGLKARQGTITEINLAFPGSEDFPLVDKKLIVVEFARS